MLVIITVRDSVEERSIKGHISRPNRPTPDQSLSWGLMVHDINFLAFAKGKK